MDAQNQTDHQNSFSQGAADGRPDPCTTWALTPLTTPPDGPQAAFAEEYAHVEVGLGPQFRRRRGTVVPIARLPAPGSTNAPVDDYGVSRLRFSQGLVDYAATNPSPTGGKPPSVAKYKGLAWTDRVRIDVDNGDPGLALALAREIVAVLMGSGIPREAVFVAFSGSKGFHVEVSAGWFGGFEPAVDLHEREKRLVRALLAGLAGGDAFDPRVYDKTRLWRTPNSVNSKSGLRKVPVTVAELDALGIEQIRSLAASPRGLVLPVVAPVPTPALVAAWEATTEATLRRGHHAHRALAGRTHGRSPGSLSGHSGPVDPDTVLRGVPEGGRNDALFRYACRLRAQRRSRAEADILVRAAARACAPPFPDAEALAVVTSAWDRYPAGAAPAAAPAHGMQPRKGVIRLG